ncbi:hypothetical protein EDB80DRAFT_758158 [Ilyonectria destructans]|nr:hypothetical protein EDB80DRAFT_758158 [Ilyonectria destructans]
MGDIRFSTPDSSSPGRKSPFHQHVRPGSAGSDSLQSGYETPTMRLEPRVSLGGGNIRPDSPPKDVQSRRFLGRNIDTYSTKSAQIISNVLQTDYDELFDMKHDPVLFTGLRLNEKDRKVEKLSEKDMRILNERDLMTPDLSEVRKLDDFERIGLKDLGKTHVKRARMQNGKLHLGLHAHSLGKTVSNREVTMSVNELVSPFRMQKGHWTPLKQLVARHV